MHSQLHYELYRVLAADRARHAPRAVVPCGANTRRPYAAGRRTPRRGWPAGWTPSPPNARSRKADRPAPSPGAGRYASRAVARSSAWSTASRSSPSTARRSASWPACRPATARTSRSPQATVPPGARTEAHYHRASEEIYLFTSGAGRMILARRGVRGPRGRLRRDPAGRRAPARQRRRRAARAAVLLLTALLARGHGDHSSFRSSGLTAGPWSTVPSGAKREPWQGQSHERSASLKLTWQ